MRHIRSALLATVLVALVSGCGDKSSTGPDPDPSGVRSGSLKFSYSGALSGNFSAEGAPQISANNVKYGSYAYGARQADTLLVTGFQATSNQRGHGTILLIEGAATGKYDMDVECTTRCALGLYLHDVSFDQESDYARMYLITDGELNLTEATSSSLKGSFQGTATDVETYEAELTLTSGSFSVGVLDERWGAMSSRAGTATPRLLVDPARVVGFEQLSSERQQRLTELLRRHRMLR